MRWSGKAALAGLLALGLDSTGWGQLRVVQYNAGSVKLGFSTVIEQIGHESVNGIARPIDVLVVEEQSPSYIETLVDTLNGIYGPGTYQAAPMVGQTAGGGLPLMVYRPASVTLIGNPIPLGTLGTLSNSRQTIKYEIRPVGYDSSADLFLYASHLRASSGAANAARRDVEVTTNRADADAMGPDKNILYIGDFNFYSGHEAGYTTLTSPGNGQAIDPLAPPLTWSGAANRILHTQSPATTAAYEGQITGGMNDRFDFQMISNALNDGQGMALIPGSYRGFGNNGTHPLSAAINSASNTWNNSGLTTSASTVLNALSVASDHIPVIADYQLPAKMSVAVSAPPRVIAGASVNANVTVTNSAPVAVAIGADKLHYTLTGSGPWSGAHAGTATATLAGNVHAISLDTSSTGIKSGTISATSSSQSVASGTFSQIVSTTVVAHARPSFDAESLDAVKVVDFGVRARGAPVPARTYAVHNLPDPSGFTAGLDLDVAFPQGDTSRLTTTLAPFSNLAADGSNAFSASFDSSVIGTFSTIYLLVSSDEDIPGATLRDYLYLHMTGTIALGGDANLDGLVDIVDLAALANDWRSPGGWHEGDFNRDNFVDAFDLQILASNWQASAANAGSSFASAMSIFGLNESNLPEPGMISTLMTCLLGICRRRRR